MAQDSPYRYLFPFEKVPPGSRILVYGAAMLGQEYLKQVLITGYCKVVGLVDKNHASYPPMVVPVYAPEDVSNLDFDYVVIALRAEFPVPEIKRMLAACGVEEDRIRYVLERPDANPAIFSEGGGNAGIGHLACADGGISVALYFGGGFGDMIIQKRFALELMRLLPDAEFDLYSVQNIAFLEWLYSDSPQVRHVVHDLGLQYASEKGNYSLAVTVIATFLLEVDGFRPDHFSERPDFVERIGRLEERCRDEALSIPTPNGIAYRRRWYNHENCYSWFNSGGIFSISDFHVGIPLLGSHENEFQELGLHRYITLNVESGASKDGRRVAKTWPMERFEAAVRLLKKAHPGITVVQLGAKDGSCLERADLRLMGKDFGLVAHVLKHALFHLDIEGGLVHLATQLGTKCIVLFGPTPVEYFGYEENINLKAGSCHGCCGLYRDGSRCARRLEEPECMYGITPEMVADAANRHLEEIGHQ